MPQELSESDIFVLLARQQRRLTIRILQEAKSVTLLELARRIGKYEFTAPSDADFQSVYLALYHNHLPRLAQARVITYDRDVGTVRPGGNFDFLVRVLEDVNPSNVSSSDM